MPQLEEILTEELRDLYDAEKQLTKHLPKIAKSASNPELKQVFTEHLEVTKNQIARLEQVFEMMGQRAKGKPCRAMKGLVEEAQEHLQEHNKGNELDTVLIASAQKVEHYEMAGYGTARTMAKAVGNKEVMNLLQETLKEEEMTDKLLSKIAIGIQKEMLREEGESEEELEGEEERYAAEAGGSRGRGSRMPAKKKVAASKSAPSKAAAKGAARGGSSNGGGKASSSASSNVTTDHEEIRRWAEERGAKPACVRGTGGKGDTGMIRLDFPGFSGEGSLEEISWEDFFAKFDEQALALLYQEQTARGQKSNFNKLIARETAELSAGGGRGSARRKRA